MIQAPMFDKPPPSMSQYKTRDVGIATASSAVKCLSTYDVRAPRRRVVETGRVDQTLLILCFPESGAVFYVSGHE